MSKHFKYSEELLSSVVKQSFSFRDVVKNMNLCLSGGTYAHIKRRIEKLGIDTSHFLGRSANSGIRHKGGHKKRAIEEILCLRNPGSVPDKTRTLRYALLQIGREHKCEGCSCGPNWLGRSLTLQIHHKDGNNLNNVEQNICFLCPNCHSQTDNYGYVGLSGPSYPVPDEVVNRPVRAVPTNDETAQKILKETA